MRSILTALAFLTVVPVRFRQMPSSEAVARSHWWYPAVGLLMGAVLAGWASVAARWLAPSLAAFVVLLAWVLLTGALHVDGFCDLCDGLFAGRSPEDRLRILKDPHVGAFGLVGGLLLLLGKYVALQNVLAAGGALWAVGGAVVAARCLVLCVAAGARYPRPEGRGRLVVESATPAEAVFFVGLAAALSVAAYALAGPEQSAGRWCIALVPPALALAAVFVLRIACCRRLGGVTGDCLGAAIELSELTFLFSWAVLLTP